MDWSIRAARLTDLDAIADFNCRLAWETERIRLDPSRIRAGVAKVLDGTAEARYLVADRTDGIIGQLMLTREWSDWRCGWFYWLQSVYVAESYRGRGVFRGLYHSALDLLRSQPDAIGLRLYVEEHNAAAQSAYERLGMSPAGYRVFEVPLGYQLTREL